MTRLHRLIDRVLRLERINGHGICPTYLYRWTLLKLPRGVGVYLHKFVGDDWSFDLHDHPKRFISIGLRGGYVETCHSALGHVFQPGADPAYCCVPITRRIYGQTIGGFLYGPVPCGRMKGYHERVDMYRVPWLRTFPATHVHRLVLLDGRPCWTIVIVLATVRKWGFWIGGDWMPWRSYVGSTRAEQAKSCAGGDE